MLHDYATGALAPEDRGGTIAERFADNLAAIKLARMLAGENAGQGGGAPAGRRAPDERELAALLRYVGWGEYDVRRQALDIGERPTAKLAELNLSSAELDALKRSSLTAYYTPRWLVAEMWRAALRLGVGDMPRAPLVLEPSCGSGLFLALRPPCVPEDALCAAEIDPLAAAIAQAVLPRATVHHAPLESLALPSVFDLVIGNVPFSDVGIYDPRVPKRLRRTTHDYFLVRAIEALRPGGVALLITGTGSLDRGAPAVRQHLCAEADLLLAVRLPLQVFSDRGAGVPSDLLVFRKLGAPQPGRRLPWTETGVLPGRGAGLRGSAREVAGAKGAITNRVFLDDPSLVIGEYDREGRAVEARNPVGAVVHAEHARAVADALPRLSSVRGERQAPRRRRHDEHAACHL
jgi:SAM-dependent methyltransferase